MTSPKIAVIGSNSMVGSRFTELYEEKNSIPLVKADLNSQVKIDITDKNSTEDFFKNQNFDVVVLFSAYTDVDEAQKQKGNKNGICWKINIEGSQNVADAAKKYNKKLIFISTEFVFDGTLGPYKEEDPVATDENSISWYGYTKVEAEKVIKSKLPDAVILRITYPYRGKFAAKDDFAKSILRKYRENTLYPMFDDQVWTPTFIDDVAPAIELILKSNESGIFHLASPTTTTPYQFAQELLKTFKEDPTKVQKGSIKEFLKNPNSTPRPANGGLKVEKIKSLGFTPTDWKEGIKKIFSQSKGQLI